MSTATANRNSLEQLANIASLQYQIPVEHQMRPLFAQYQQPMQGLAFQNAAFSFPTVQFGSQVQASNSTPLLPQTHNANHSQNKSSSSHIPIIPQLDTRPTIGQQFLQTHPTGPMVTVPYEWLAANILRAQVNSWTPATIACPQVPLRLESNTQSSEHSSSKV